MRMALTTLALLNKLSPHPVIKGSFLQPPLLGSAAYNCLHFLELLVCAANLPCVEKSHALWKLSSIAQVLFVNLMVPT